MAFHDWLFFYGTPHFSAGGTHLKITRTRTQIQLTSFSNPRRRGGQKNASRIYAGLSELPIVNCRVWFLNVPLCTRSSHFEFNN